MFDVIPSSVFRSALGMTRAVGRAAIVFLPGDRSR